MYSFKKMCTKKLHKSLVLLKGGVSCYRDSIEYKTLIKQNVSPQCFSIRNFGYNTLEIYFFDTSSYFVIYRQFLRSYDGSDSKFGKATVYIN